MNSPQYGHLTIHMYIIYNLIFTCNHVKHIRVIYIHISNYTSMYMKCLYIDLALSTYKCIYNVHDISGKTFLIAYTQILGI